MTRTIDYGHRSEILDRASAYVLEHGLAELSLRPLARAVGISPRTLLHHFGSKEAIVAAVIRRLRERQLSVFAELRRREFDTPSAVCKAAWAYMTAPAVMPMLRLFFETYALALRDPQRFPGFLDGAVEDWLAFLSAPLCTAGLDRTRARAIATIVLAGYRGFMLDFAASQDRSRIGNALDLWAESLNVLFPQKGETHAQ